MEARLRGIQPRTVVAIDFR